MEATPPNPTTENHTTVTERMGQAGRAIGDTLMEDMRGEAEMAKRAYNRLGAFATRRMISWTERSADRALGREEDARSDQAIYEEMSEKVNQALKTDRKNAPSERKKTIAPEHSTGYVSVFSGRVKSQQQKLESMQAAIRGELKSPPPPSKLAETDSMFDYSIMSRKQQRDARKIATELSTLNDKRAFESGARKMMGDSGRVSRVRTYFYRRSIRKETNAQLNRGEIGYGEAYERGKHPRANAITVTPRLQGLRSAERTIRRISRSLPEHLSRRVADAKVAEERAVRKQEKLEKRKEKLKDREKKFNEQLAA